MGGQQGGSDSGSNSNDDCSPSETPTVVQGMVSGGATSALQTRLLNTQLKGNRVTGGGAGDQLIYVNSSSASNSNSSTIRDCNNSNANNSNSSSNELATGTQQQQQHPPMSSSPAPVYGQKTGRYLQQQQQQHQQMTILGNELLGQEMTAIQGGAGDTQLYYTNNHFVAQHSHGHQLHHSHAAHPQQTVAHIPPGMTVIPCHSLLPQQATAVPVPTVTGATTTVPAQIINYQVLPGGHQVMAAAVTGGVGVGVNVSSSSGGGAYAALTTVPAPINSCYNCGSQAHDGLDCRETSMEDAIHHSNYKLDYKTHSNTAGEGIAEEEDGAVEVHESVVRKRPLMLRQNNDSGQEVVHVILDDDDEGEEDDMDKHDEDEEDDDVIEVSSSGGESNGPRGMSNHSSSSSSVRMVDKTSTGEMLAHRFTAMGLHGTTDSRGSGGGGSSGKGGKY